LTDVLYDSQHNHGPPATAHVQHLGPENIMWIIELNVAGYHYTRQMPDFKRRPFRFSPRNLHWPAPRPSQAA